MNLFKFSDSSLSPSNTKKSVFIGVNASPYSNVLVCILIHIEIL